MRQETITVSVCLNFPCSSQPSVILSHWHSGENCLVCRRHVCVCARRLQWKRPAKVNGRKTWVYIAVDEVVWVWSVCTYLITDGSPCLMWASPCLSALYPLHPFISLPVHQSIRDNYWWNETSGKCMRGDLHHSAIKPQPVYLSPLPVALPFPLPPAVLWIGP